MTALRAALNRLRRRLWRLVFFRTLFGEASGGALRWPSACWAVMVPYFGWYFWRLTI